MLSVVRGGARAVRAATPLVTAPIVSARSYADLKFPATKVTTLENGMRVATETTPNETATVGVWIDSGSRFENDANNGVAHFLEHMAFKGTSKRSQADLELSIENMGGSLNAYTSREQTVYVAKVMKQDVEAGVDILADILQNSTLSEANIERERGVILREAQEVESQTQEMLFDHLHSVAFQGSPLARTILGPDENIRSLKRADLQEYISTHYTADRMVLAAAGGVDHDQLVKFAEKHFADLRTAPENNREVVHEPSVYSGSEVRVFKSHLDKVHFALAVKSVSWSDPDYYAMLVAQAMVGEWSKTSGGGANHGSRLANVVASNNLADRFTAWNTCYSDIGLWGVHGECDPKQLDDITYVIEQEWIRLAQNPSEAEVARAVNQVKTSLLMQLDGTSAVCEDIGRSLLTYGRRLTPVEVFARLDAVDAAAIQRVGQKYLYNVDPVMACVGNVREMPDYSRLRGWTYWLRL